MSADAAIDGMKSVQARFGGRGPKNFLKKFGVYRCEVQTTGGRPTEKNGLTYWSDLKVISAKPFTHPDVPAGATPHMVGETVTYQENKCDWGLDGKKAKERYKGYLGTLSGITTDEDLDKRMDRFVGEKGSKIQAGTFTLIDVVVYPKKLPAVPEKNLKGITIENFKWGNVDPTEAEIVEIDKRRVAAGLPTLAIALGEASPEV